MIGAWIYILTTRDNLNRFKLGMTRHDPNLRLKQLRTADPKLALYVAYFIPSQLTLNIRQLEAEIHKHLGNRILFDDDDDKDSEWFNGDASQAPNQVDWILEGLGCTVTDNYVPDANEVVKFWGGDVSLCYAPSLPLDKDGNYIF